ncbi:unnamed protein product, partial [Acanthoscelides obtectus]
YISLIASDNQYENEPFLLVVAWLWISSKHLAVSVNCASWRVMGLLMNWCVIDHPISRQINHLTSDRMARKKGIFKDPVLEFNVRVSNYEGCLVVTEEEGPHHTFPHPSERNIHAVVRGVPVNFSDTETKGELEQRGYSPLHIIRLKRSGGAPMPLVVVILPKTEKSQQVFNEHELLGLANRVEVQKNSRLIGQCHRCQNVENFNRNTYLQQRKDAKMVSMENQ